MYPPKSHRETPDAALHGSQSYEYVLPTYTNAYSRLTGQINNT